MILLSQKLLKQLLTTERVIEICEQTYLDYGNGKTVNPTKLTLDLGESSNYPPYEGFMNAMPAYVGFLDTAGIKWAGGLFGERKKLALPYVTSIIALMNPRTGVFEAFMDGELITNMRTGAQTAVALKYLTKKKCITVGLYGAGVQGRTQVHAISKLFSISKLTVYDIDDKALTKYKSDMSSVVDGEIRLAQTAHEAAQSDVVICVTQSKQKYLKYEWLNGDTILFPMGSYQEVEDQIILRADTIIVDHIEQCLHRGALKELHDAGRLEQSRINATLGEIVAGHKSYEHGDNRLTICIPIGMGAIDIAVAKLAADFAKEAGYIDTFSIIGG